MAFFTKSFNVSFNEDYIQKKIVKIKQISNNIINSNTDQNRPIC